MLAFLHLQLLGVEIDHVPPITIVAYSLPYRVSLNL